MKTNNAFDKIRLFAAFQVAIQHFVFIYMGLIGLGENIHTESIKTIITSFHGLIILFSLSRVSYYCYYSSEIIGQSY